MNQRSDFFIRWPNVSKVNRRSIGAGADWLGGDVDADRPGKCVCDDQRRGHQEIGFDVCVNARFKVTVSRENGNSDDLVVDDGLLNRRVQWSGVPNTGCTAVADSLEAELIEVGLQTSVLEVSGDNT